MNVSPYKDGWFMKIKINEEGKQQFEKLLDDKAYKALLEENKKH